MDSHKPGGPEAHERELHVEFEAAIVQLRALGECVEQLVAAVEECSRSLPDDAHSSVSKRLDDIRWSLGRIW